jgi:LPS sulfotransferase NodH
MSRGTTPRGLCPIARPVAADGVAARRLKAISRAGRHSPPPIIHCEPARSYTEPIVPRDYRQQAFSVLELRNTSMTKALIIASEVRSGSTFVAESIAYHFQRMHGYMLFNLTKEPFAALNHCSSHDEILGKYNSLYRNPEGWLAAKIMCPGLSVVVREARKSEPLREAFFGSSTYWIIVRRRAKVQQAISLAFAKKTAEWHAYSTDEAAANRSEVTFGDTEDALRTILLSDTYLEAFSDLIAGNRKIEVFYEDFVSDPRVLIEQVYDVLGVTRPDSVPYIDETKIRRTATARKQQLARDFNAWLAENHHNVQGIDGKAVAAFDPARAGPGPDRQADELAYYKDRVALLEREASVLRKRLHDLGAMDWGGEALD